MSVKLGLAFGALLVRSINVPTTSKVKTLKPFRPVNTASVEKGDEREATQAA